MLVGSQGDNFQSWPPERRAQMPWEGMGRHHPGARHTFRLLPPVQLCSCLLLEPRSASGQGDARVGDPAHPTLHRSPRLPTSGPSAHLGLLSAQSPHGPSLGYGLLRVCPQPPLQPTVRLRTWPNLSEPCCLGSPEGLPLGFSHSSGRSGNPENLPGHRLGRLYSPPDCPKLGPRGCQPVW